MKTGAQIADTLRSQYYRHWELHGTRPHNFCLADDEVDRLFTHLRRIRRDPCSYMGVHICVRKAA